MRIEKLSFASGENGDGFYYVWEPKNFIKPKLWLHIMHGMAEHSARYEAFAAFLNERGVYVTADDHRGHGKTGEANGNLYHLADDNGWNQMVDDQWQLISHIGAQHDLPLVIFGHSMGSFLATRFCQHYGALHESRLMGLILSGSNYAPSWVTRSASLIAKVERARCGKRNSSSVLEALSFGAFNKAFKPSRTEKDWLSSDPQVVDRYLADPLCGGPLTTQSWYDFLRGLAELSSPTAMAKISCDLPIYVFSGALDPVGQNGKGITDLVNVLHRAGVREVQSKLYAGGRHEMLNEVNYQEVYEDVWQWLAGLSIAQAEVLDLTGIGGAESG